MTAWLGGRTGRVKVSECDEKLVNPSQRPLRGKTLGSWEVK